MDDLLITHVRVTYLSPTGNHKYRKVVVNLLTTAYCTRVTDETKRTHPNISPNAATWVVLNLCS